MSEALEKVSGIRHLPLFPLPLVLLPNELLPLHIFEPRYRQMLKDVALRKNMFGVSFFNPQESFIEKPTAGSVGCVAKCAKRRRCPTDARTFWPVGIVRYRLIDYVDGGEPYLLGDVEFFEDEKEGGKVLNPLATKFSGFFGASR
jgi:ATP-dependent Lon protease